MGPRAAQRGGPVGDANAIDSTTPAGTLTISAARRSRRPAPALGCGASHRPAGTSATGPTRNKAVMMAVPISGTGRQRGSPTS